MVPAASRAGAAVDKFNTGSTATGNAVRQAASGMPGLANGLSSVAAGAGVLETNLGQVVSGLGMTSKAALNASTAMGTVGTAAAGVSVGMTRINSTLNATRGPLDAHVLAWQRLQKELRDTVPAAASAGSSLDRLGKHANDNINAMQSTPGNIAAQFQDIGVTAAGGMSPLLIALQQGTQLSAAFAGGGLKNLGAALKQVLSPASLLTIAIVALIAYLIQLAMEFVSASGGANSLQKALDNAKLSTNGFGDAQSILGGILDLTTGKVKDQSDAFVALARAQTAQAKIQAQIRQQEADAALKDQARQKTFIGGGPVGLQITKGYDYAAGVIDTFRSGGYSGDSGQNADKAIKQLERMLELGQLTKDEYIKAAKAVSDYSVETENIKTYERLGEAIDGDTQAIKSFLNETTKVDRSSERLTARLAREAEAVETLIRGNYKAAEAYRTSTAAGKMAEVQAEAAAKGIKARGDAQIYAARELRKWVSEQAASGAANNAAMREQIRIQQTVNKAVASGTISVENASIALGNMIEQRKLLNAIDVAKMNGDGEGEKALRIALKELTEQQIAYNAAVREANDLAAADDVNRKLPLMQKEIELEKRLGVERMKALRGLSGDALENELARLNDERERAGILLEYEGKIAVAAAAGHMKLVEALEAERKKRLELLGVQQSNTNNERTFEQDRQRALDTAHEIANIVGGRIGSAIGDLADALDKMDKLTGGNDAAGIGKFLKDTKIFGKSIADHIKGISAGAQIGSAADGIMDALGIKSSKTGAQIGGAIGQFAGPLGAIAGSIVGGLIGGMLKSTPRASATVSIIAGEAMDTAIKGSSGKLKKAAGAMADALIAGLEDMAAQLGGQLTGDAQISVGMRNGKYRVDPTGQGITKTSKGAVDFGEDQAAAIAYAMQVAIQQGVITGMSESMKRLIMGDGDFQTQLKKALSFQSVFDELAQRDDPVKYAQDQVTKWYDAMLKIFKEAGATGEELAELERLTGIKRAEAAKEAANDTNSIERQRRDLEIALMEAQGDKIGALTAQRELELQAIDDILKPLQQQVWLAQDAAELAAERYGLETQLLQLQGNTTALRERERATISEANRDLYDLINTMQDWQESVNKSKALFESETQLRIDILNLEAEVTGDATYAAQALKLAREQELRAADASLVPLLLRKFYLEDEAAAAAKTNAINAERFNLETRLLTVLGDTGALREREIAALDPANQALLRYIFSLEDAKAAAEAAAAAQKAIADEIDGLQRQWYDLTGQVDKVRDIDLGKLLSDEARDLQKQIWAYQDAMAAQQAATEAAAKALEEYNKRLEDARNAVETAYNRERGILEKNADAFRDFVDDIRNYIKSLRGEFATPGQSTAINRGQYLQTLSAARGGDQTAMGNFTRDADAYLEAARRSSATEREYQNAVAEVMSGALGLEKMGVREVANFEREMRALDAQVAGILDLNEGVISLGLAISNYNAVLNERTESLASATTEGFNTLATQFEQFTQTAIDQDENRKAEAETVTGRLMNLELLWESVIRNRALYIATEGLSVTIANTANDNPVPVDQV